MVKLTRNQVIKKLEKENKQLKKFGVKKIGLFGSVLKGTQNKRSDVDFLVSFKRTDFDSYTNLLILLEDLFRKRIDLVIESDLKPELKYVKKEAEYVRL